MRVVVAGSMLSIALLALAGPAGARDSGNDRSRGGVEQPGARSHDRTPGTGTVDRGRPDVSRAGTTVASPNPQYTPGSSRYGNTSATGGCAPGLAKRHTGCLPPGQAKKI
jgi:hypothetical protein